MQWHGFCATATPPQIIAILKTAAATATGTNFIGCLPDGQNKFDVSMDAIRGHPFGPAMMPPHRPSAICHDSGRSVLSNGRSWILWPKLCYRNDPVLLTGPVREFSIDQGPLIPTMLRGHRLEDQR